MNYTTLNQFATFLTAAVSTVNECQSDDACPALYSCIQNVCEHKGIFPLEPREMFGSILLASLVGLANVGGMGGSFIAAPILMTIFNYAPLQTIRLVYCVVFGGALGNFATNFFLRREASDRPVIDYDVTLIAMPMLLCGTSVGVLLNTLTPSFITLTGLVIVMVQTAQKLLRRAKSQYKDENRAKRIHCEASTEVDTEMKEMGANGESTVDYQSYYMVAENPRMYQIVQEDRLLFPWRKYRELFLLIVLFVVMFLLKGTRSFKSVLGFNYCSPGYWFLYLMTLVMCFVFEKRVSSFLLEDAEVRERAFIMPSSEFRVTQDNITKLKNLSLMGGSLAGFLGIGVGTIMNPKMLEMGLSGSSAAATSGFFVIFTAFLSMFQTLLLGGVTMTEIAFFCPLAFVGSLGISLGIRYIVKKYQRPSLVLFSLAAIVVMGIIIIPGFSIYKSFSDPWLMFESHSVC